MAGRAGPGGMPTLQQNRRVHRIRDMTDAPSTVWTILRRAALGEPEARAAFAETYLDIARAYFAARWRGSPLAAEVDDATQEVFVDCFKPEGALVRVDPERPGGFRPYLYGVLRTVALHVETRRARRHAHGPQVPLDEAGLAADAASASSVFDREWMRGLLREAARRQARRAEAQGESALRRVELMRLRFQEGLPIRDIAVRWNVDADWVHHQYAKAREEYRAAIREVAAEHLPEGTSDVEAAVDRLLATAS